MARVPALIVAVPEKAFVAVKERVPTPDLARDPVPLIAPERVAELPGVLNEATLPELIKMGVARVKLLLSWSVAEPVNVMPAVF